MNQEETILRTDYLQLCNELGHCKAELKKEKELTTKLTQDYDTLVETNALNFAAVEESTAEIAKLREEISELTLERRSLAETVSNLELQVRDLRNSLTANLDNQHRDGLKYDKLVKANEQLQKDNKTLTAISLDSLISLNQLLSKNH